MIPAQEEMEVELDESDGLNRSDLFDGYFGDSIYDDFPETDSTGHCFSDADLGL